MTSHEGKLGRTLLLLLLIAGAVTMTLPFLWTVSTSLKDPGAVYAQPRGFIDSFIPRDPKTGAVSIQWSTYARVWTHPTLRLGRWYLISIIVAVATTFGRVLTSSLAAYAFARLSFPGRDKLFLLYLATLMIPVHVTIIPEFILISLLPRMFTALGQYIAQFVTHHPGCVFGAGVSFFTVTVPQALTAFGSHLGMDTFFALIAPGIFTAFGTFMLRQFFLTIPKDLEDAALIDGCSHLGIWWRIILPLSVPALVTLTIFTFLGSWDNFMWPLIVTNTKEMMTIPVGLARLQSTYQQEITLMLAASVQVLVPVFVLFIACQKRITEGIVMSGFGGI